MTIMQNSIGMVQFAHAVPICMSPHLRMTVHAFTCTRFQNSNSLPIVPDQVCTTLCAATHICMHQNIKQPQCGCVLRLDGCPRGFSHVMQHTLVRRLFRKLRQARSSDLHFASEPCVSNSNPTATSVPSISEFVAKVSRPDLESVGHSGPSGLTKAGPQGHAFPARRLWPETGISSGGESDLIDASDECSFYSCQEEGPFSNSDLTGSSCVQSTDLDTPGRNPISSQDWPSDPSSADEVQYTNKLEDEEDTVDLTPKSPQTIFEGTTETAIVTVPVNLQL